MDPTEHGHIPYVVILVRALEDWKKTVRIIHVLVEDSFMTNHIARQ